MTERRLLGTGPIPAPAAEPTKRRGQLAAELAAPAEAPAVQVSAAVPGSRRRLGLGHTSAG
ncbi:hypothetical protein ACWCQL_27050 [Streptomyces sp. NPDC002073]